MKFALLIHIKMTNSNKDKIVLVTGGSGFVGIHCILQLLEQDYTVKTTLRSMNRQEEVKNMLRVGGIFSFENLSFIETNLSKDDNWSEAVKDCDYVLHVATPISLEVPKDENEVILPAVEGTLRVLKAAKEAGVKRVVLTSSFAAVGYSHNDPKTLITEESWTDPSDKTLSAYLKSKTLAEKAAWNYVANEGKGLELSVINPMGIFGPSLGPDISSGFEVLKQMLDGTMKAIPKVSFGIVDVRDVADLHLRAMTNPAANGERFLAFTGEIISLPEIAQLLKNKLGNKASKVSTTILPNWAVRIIALFNDKAKNIVPQLNRIKNASNLKAKTTLNWKPRTSEEALLASAESLFQFGGVKI
jgi:nucleoside-diphosphate-sugar epimerase